MKCNVLFSSLLAGVMLSSCSSNTEDEILTVDQPSKFNVTLTSSDQVLKTRATEEGTETEKQINHVAFYVFKKSGSLEKSIAASSQEITNNAYTIECSTGDKDVYAVTNDPTLYGEIQKGIQKSDFEKRITKQFLSMPASPFAMIGYYPTLTLTPTTDASTPSKSISIDVTRLVGKVSVSLTEAVKSKFQLVGFKIVNANPYSNYVKQDASYKNYNTIDEIDPNNENAFNAWTESYYADGYAQVGPTAAAYAFENWNTDPRRGNTTCIIIEGKYDGKANSFYRFNLGGKAVNWAFNRNTHYKVVISNVYESGYETEDKAEQPDGGKPTDPLVQDVKIEATLTITPWDVVDQDDEIGKE